MLASDLSLGGNNELNKKKNMKKISASHFTGTKSGLLTQNFFCQ